MMNGGYLMVSKTDTNLYGKLNNALTSGKPVLWYEDENICYYIDTITKSGTDIVLTKGGKTITIENDGNITEVGDLLTIMENIVDKDGNLRFIDVNNNNVELTGVTYNYSKSSLSGTHLMVVLSATIDNGTTIPNLTVMANIPLPTWISDKIVTVFSNIVQLKEVNCYQNDWQFQSMKLALGKDVSGITIQNIGDFTASSTKTFRVQFDLLIDAE